MLMRPCLFPDELDYSYFGRLMCANGVSTEKDMATLMAREEGMANSPRREIPTVVLLARMASLDVPVFVRHHTTLPLRRSITSYQPELIHGCDTNLAMLNHSAMRQARPGAYFCHQCVEEDEGFHGLSYWRRNHQIPGLFWCQKHEISLNYTESTKAFLRPPSAFLEDCETMSEDWVGASRKNEHVHRFLTIASDLMGREKPFSVKDVMPALRARAQTQGFRLYRTCKTGDLLSDAVVERFGRVWLATVSPSIAYKPAGMLFPQLDGVLYLSTSASSATAYMLALSVLFHSSEDALNALVSPNSVPRERCSRRVGRSIDRDQLKSLYVDLKGNYSAIAASLATSYAAVSHRLEPMGLPNLSGMRGRIGKAIIAFFVEDLSMDASAASAGISRDALEDAVKTCGVGFSHVLRKMFVPRNVVTAPRRPLKLTPREAESAVGL